MWWDDLSSLSMATYFPLISPDGKTEFRRTTLDAVQPGDSFWTVKAADQSPPLFELLTKVCVQWLGPNVLASRLTSMAAGCLCLLWFGVLAWRQNQPYVRRVLIWSLLLYAGHPLLIEYAQTGRAYSLGVALLSMGFSLWMLRWKDGFTQWVEPSWLEICLFSSSSYAHYQAALAIALLLCADFAVAAYRHKTVALLKIFTFGSVFLVWIFVAYNGVLSAATGQLAWGKHTLPENVIDSLQNAADAVHMPWWLIAFTVFCGLQIWQKPRENSILKRRVSALLLMMVATLLLASGMAVKAGMNHARYYIFVLPLVITCMALIFAKIQGRTWAALVGVTLLLTNTAGERIVQRKAYGDYRSMAKATAEGIDSDTPILSPTNHGLMIYRTALFIEMKIDPQRQLVEVTSEPNVKEICQQIVGKDQVAVAGGGDRARFNTIYAHCGAQWPIRTYEQFQFTFVEHWRKH